MAYTKTNFNKRAKHIVEVYKSVKFHDVPDTFIVQKIFPKHNILISYRGWMRMKARELKSNPINADNGILCN